MATTPNRATRRAPAKSAPKVSDKPKAPKKVVAKNDAAITLADIDAEAAGVTEELANAQPFVISIGEDEDGEEITITLSHPALLSYEIVASGDQDAVLASAMSTEEYEKFLDLGFNTVQAGVVFMMWRKHYGLASSGE